MVHFQNCIAMKYKKNKDCIRKVEIRMEEKQKEERRKSEKEGKKQV